MTAWTSEEEQRRRRRRSIVRGLAIGGAAIGLPALLNATIARRARKAPAAEWGRRHRYAWELGDVVFQRVGEGEPLVLLHSFGPGHDSIEWRALAERLGDGHQLFAPDLPGWGASERPSLDYDAELYIEFLIDFLIDVVRRRAVVVASGLAAAYAVQVAVDRPELLRGLVLSCPLGIDVASDQPDLKDAVIHRLLRLPLVGTSALNLYSSRRGIEHHLREEVFATAEAVTDERIDHCWRGAHEEGSRAAFAAYLAGYLNHGVRKVAPRLKVPTTLVWGREAVHPAVASADLWLRVAPDLELEVIDDAGVLPHDEAADEFAEAVARFLERLPG